MLLVADLTAWLTSLNVSGLPPISTLEGRWDAAIPGAQIIFSSTGGAGTTNERVLDIITIQMAVRGDTDDSPVDAGGMMAAVDDALMGLKAPFSINGKRCVDFDYSGGPPRFYQWDPSTRQSIYMSQYVASVARSVF